MKDKLKLLIEEAIKKISLAPPSDIEIGTPRHQKYGDFSCNVALSLAKSANKKPRDLAQAIITALPASSDIERVEIAGPGFINFFLTTTSVHAVIGKILAEKARFGTSSRDEVCRVQIEFVSANPTGPLHVGHGRGAALGACIANLLEATGFDVHREYYVNDAGRQMDILAVSVWLRYLELCGETPTFPCSGYHGDYIWDIGATLHRTHGDRLRSTTAQIFAEIPADEPTGDKETHIDALINRAKSLLNDDYKLVFDTGVDSILENIRTDLSQFGINFDQWYRERQLYEQKTVDQVISRLQEAGFIYQKNGAKWFSSTQFGDKKDRVVVRENGQTTYFASDIAYHQEKFERGFNKVINIWGADHHGYIPRVKAALQALGYDCNRLHILLVQFAVLYRGNEKIQMSTRSGEFVTLRQLRKEVGNDAARFFYIMRRSDQHLDFDLELAKSQSSDNPIYYIQYAHARICSVFNTISEQGLSWDAGDGSKQLHLLEQKHEQALCVRLNQYPEVVRQAALDYSPHLLANYLRGLANDFHPYYNAHKFIVADAALRNARLTLIAAVKQVLQNGLHLLGIAPVEAM